MCSSLDWVEAPEKKGVAVHRKPVLATGALALSAASVGGGLLASAAPAGAQSSGSATTTDNCIVVPISLLPPPANTLTICVPTPTIG